MIIEFCGVPGAGKTTIAHALVPALEAAGNETSLPLEAVSARRPRPERVIRKTLLAVGETFSHPINSIRALFAVARSRQPGSMETATRLLNWLVLRSLLRQARRRPGIHVFDQGVIQELCSLGFRGDPWSSFNVSDPGVRLLGPDLIVVVDVDPALADSRLAARPGRQSRVEAINSDRLESVERQGVLIDSLLIRWQRRFGDRLPTRVSHMPNADGTINVDELVTTIQSLDRQQSEVSYV